VNEEVKEGPLVTLKEEKENPLVTLMEVEEHSMQLLLTPKSWQPQASVRLMYERVGSRRPPLLTHLSDPVVQIVPLSKRAQHHVVRNLPMGEYIVCGESVNNEGIVLQSTCFNVIIQHLDNSVLQSGVIAIIAVALVIVTALVIFAIWHRLGIAKRLKKERQLAEKVERFARKEAELAERGECVPVIYPDPSVPYEERCIM